ncbi:MULTISPECIES: hypothetical protein [Amycolatopsis]|uniref:Integral membrane protein n=2 Tax=Amycolatopsis TaxID=1813 RepID=A0A076MZL6_AMYME|nr:MULTISPECIES: hypothetical protein [Amycolatopsis]AIJ26804.1 hypothetical protein AMETH_6712 [Amycolatopsis methanolica 239]MCF6422013.1 hypothetical protein [Amycolatopsis tucumanensis]
MITGFGVAVAVSAALVAVWAFVAAARGREPGRALLVALGVVEVLLVAQLVVGVVLLIGGDRPGSMVTYLAYLVGSLVILPVGAAWALAERSRSSTVILGVACLAIPVMVERIHQIWSAGHG